MTERLCHWPKDDSSIPARGFPSEAYAHLYQGWGEGDIGGIVYLTSTHTMLPFVLLLPSQLQELDLLFRDHFWLHTETMKLKTSKKPQLQLSRRVSDFVCDHDGPHSLLIAHYTGHAVFRDLENYLQLTATMDPSQRTAGNHAAVANWNKVEETLRSDEVESDVLTIFDIIYAANFTQRRLPAPDPAPNPRAASVTVKKDQPKLFELIAKPIDEASIPGGSLPLTRALTEALIDLLKKYGDIPISTFRLVQQINLNKQRHDSSALLWSRLGLVSKHKFIRPMNSRQARIYEMSGPRGKGVLTLGFELRDPSLKREQIEYLIRSLSNALRGKTILGLCKINWRNMSS